MPSNSKRKRNNKKKARKAISTDKSSSLQIKEQPPSDNDLQFSSSHYSKIPANFLSISNDPTQDESTVVNIQGGFNEDVNNDGNESNIQAASSSGNTMPMINPSSSTIKHRESMLSQSLRNSSSFLKSSANDKQSLQSQNVNDDSVMTSEGALGVSGSPYSSFNPKFISSTTTKRMRSGSLASSVNLHQMNSSLQRTSKLSNNNGPNNTRKASAITVDVENPDPAVIDIVSRHLINDTDTDVLGSYSHNGANFDDNASSVFNDEFDSLHLQGGDITREIYKWKNDKTNINRTPKRSKSFTSVTNFNSGSFTNNNHHLQNNDEIKNILRDSVSHIGGNIASGTSSSSSSTAVLPYNNQQLNDYNTISEPEFNVSEILLPGGFRRSFIAHKRQRLNKNLKSNEKPTFFTRNFIEFLTLYGHFAGEELSEDEDEYKNEDEQDEDEELIMYTERDTLLRHRTSFMENVENEADIRGIPQLEHKQTVKKNVTTTKAVLLLLKAFIGTGILFLPKGFFNGGLLFSIFALMFFSILSYWCFLLLIDVRVKSQVNSFGDIGNKYFGSKMRSCILTSIVLSQIGFASAYIVFVAQNLKSVTTAIFPDNSIFTSIPILIFTQLLIFIPLSLTRNIAKLSGTALIADFFILCGIVYIYYTCSFEIILNGMKRVEFINPSNWTIFIGTAVFTYEGIGLLIPIQESMKHPEKFTSCLGGVMIGITVVFISIGGIAYLAYGDNVQTVVLNNFPQDSRLVNIVQSLYALAILLSTPLQLFPAIKILENGIFGTGKLGKYNLRIKWRKNFFRILLVILTSLISWIGNSDLDKFVALIGSFACIPLIYIYPPVLHMRSYWEEIMSGNAFSEDRDYFLNNHISFYFNALITIFGVSLMIYTSFDTIRTWIF